MKTETSTIKQSTKWLLGLLTIWLVVEVFTPNRTQLIGSHAENCTTVVTEADESDFVASGIIHTPVGVVSPLSGFSFSSTADMPTYLHLLISKLFCVDFSGNAPKRRWLFNFSHVFLEHQIAINAP